MLVRSANINNENKTAEGYHQGFYAASVDVYNSLMNFCGKRKIDTENARIIITGHSRGGAVANIVAARLNAESYDGVIKFKPENISAYTFASPNLVYLENIEHEYELYDNIFNIINPEDIVANLPLETWGYVRYGKSFEFDTTVHFMESIITQIELSVPSLEAYYAVDEHGNPTQVISPYDAIRLLFAAREYGVKLPVKDSYSSKKNEKGTENYLSGAELSAYIDNMHMPETYVNWMNQVSW